MSATTTAPLRARLAVWFPTIEDCNALAKRDVRFKRGKIVPANNGRGFWVHEAGAKTKFNGAICNVFVHELTTMCNHTVGYGQNKTVVHIPVAEAKASALRAG